MQLRYLRSLLPACETIVKVTALAWSPNSQRLAAVTLHRIVHLFDENGELKDKFSTKPADSETSKVYIVTSMVFSPDSTRLAIGQSDNIIFVYNLGAEWGSRKSICNKFQQTAPVVSIVWPSQYPNEMSVVFGLADGKVKATQLGTNRTVTVYDHGRGSSAVTCLACSPDGSTCIAGHTDGSIYRFSANAILTGTSAMKTCHYGGVPTVLAWGASIVASGPDCKVAFYDNNGSIQQQFDYSTNISTAKEFYTACFNPCGDTVALGHSNGFHIFSLTTKGGLWEDVGGMNLDNLYSISALAWKPDGSQLAVGGLLGNVDIFDACLRKELYQKTFEFTYVTKSQVIVKHLASGTSTVLKSQHGWEILKLNVYHDQYLIAHTPESLLVGNLETCKLSEVLWRGSGSERFLLDHPAVCMVYNAGELSLVEYGSNEVLGACRTEHLSPFLISVRLNDHITGPDHPNSNAEGEEENKKIAYLVDLHTIRILDLVSGVTAGALGHGCKIDWLELNPRASHLLFRDTKQQLNLFNLITQERSVLLSFCGYVQWVPDSDVVVAQSHGNLYVWYSIRSRDQATIFPIKGEVEGIERTQGRTEVLVEEGSTAVRYVLDEALIEFGMALEALAYEYAMAILEPLQLAPETEAMWEQLADAALCNKKMAVAERCYAALGDVAKARYIHKVNQAKDEVEAGIDAMDHYSVRVKLALLQHQWKVAETLLLEHGQVNAAMQMYTECHRWNEAISVAESQNHPDAATLKKSHFEWLLLTAQEEEAGEMKEAEGDVSGAITLFLKARLPGRAADCVNNRNPSYSFPDDITETIASALWSANMFEKAGDFSERLGKYESAKDAYKRGHAYRRAIDLSRRIFPGEVPALEEEWGDWLVSQDQVDTAINHFIEAGCSIKAIESAIASRQWTRAVQIVDSEDIEIALPFCKRLARHFEAVKQYADAEKYFVRGKLASEAIEMYIRANKWEAAHKAAAKHLSVREAAALYLQRARELEAVAHYKDAEKLYIEAQEHDLAINMYTKARQFDHVIRLVSKYRQDALTDTHLHLAQQLENEGSFRDAETHFRGAQDWKSTVKMYTANGLWEDALRVAKLFGGVTGSKQVAYSWAVSLGGEAGAQLLVKLGLVEQAIGYAMETGAFEHAFSLCRTSLKHKLPEVQLKYAIFLEDQGRFRDAEVAFIKAGKAREAIDMYVHQQDWAAAMRVADLCDPAAMSDILVAQAQIVMKEELHKAEALLIKAKRPDLAIMMYRDKMQWEDALRVAEYFLPSKVPEIHCDLAEYMRSQNGGEDSVESLRARGRALELSRNYSEAIDLYLELDSSLLADFDKLEQVWGLAISLAKEYVEKRLPEVVNTVAGRLVEVERYEAAGELFEGINAMREAASVYVQAGLWEKAKAIGTSSGPPLQQQVDDHFKEHLIERGDATELVKLGHVPEALELFVQQGDWLKVHEIAASLGPDGEKSYSICHAKECLQNDKCAEAIDVLSQHGVPLNAQAFELCSFVACKIISAVGTLPQDHLTMQKLREILYRLVSTLTLNRDMCPPQVLTELKRLLIIVNFVTLRYMSIDQDLQEMQAKLSISLLRYIGTIPVDKAFYEAGMACKQVGWQDMGFVYLNRYLDIVEAIDDEDASTIDNANFESSDIPQDFPVPESHYLEDMKREEVRDWIIQLSMDQQIRRGLPTRPCEGCGSNIYAASLVCVKCKMESEMCFVTGYPVAFQDRVLCKACKMPANRHDWNTYIHRCQTCPWCMVPQQPVY